MGPTFVQFKKVFFFTNLLWPMAGRHVRVVGVRGGWNGEWHVSGETLASLLVVVFSESERMWFYFYFQNILCLGIFYSLLVQVPSYLIALRMIFMFYGVSPLLNLYIYYCLWVFPNLNIWAFDMWNSFFLIISSIMIWHYYWRINRRMSFYYVNEEG